MPTDSEKDRRPKIAIGFFGITRSLTWTLASIRQNIITPARELGEVRLFAHLYQQTKIDNPRSGESTNIDPDEYKLLNCDEVILESPGECLNQSGYPTILAHGDAFNDEGKSLANLIHQLNSLQKLGTMIAAWKPDIVILARPDLEYHDSLLPFIKRHLSLAGDKISVPNWQWYGGINDRFAVCGPAAAWAYTQRIQLIPDYLKQSTGPLPAERFLRYALARSGIYPMSMPIRASRVRSNGDVVNENFRPISIGKRLRWIIDWATIKPRS